VESVAFDDRVCTRLVDLLQDLEFSAQGFVFCGSGCGQLWVQGLAFSGFRFQDLVFSV